ncbi:hypothetical protein SAMN05443633_11766 [Chryseobacterium arachidis]|uniref:Uncharacterized protein n=1 Tax=Chryseobacterium arachidis TaxID=1416778 RepID=A0A1M5KRV8_9FLAO|nr:hypothetical protein SAMN05443633_11766 [Chryseobacterium arachidis]
MPNGANDWKSENALIKKAKLYKIDSYFNKCLQP